MRIPTNSLKRALEVTMFDAVKRLKGLEGPNEQALREDYREWIEATEGCKDKPLVLYTNQINIEQL